MPHVIVFRKDILPISETFIAAQVHAYRRWSAQLVGFQSVDGIVTDNFAPTILFDVNRRSERILLKRDQYLPVIGWPTRRFHKLLTIKPPDIVHSHFGYDAILIADAVADLRIPLLVTLHGTDVLRDWNVWASGKDGFFFRFYPHKIQQLFRSRHVHFIAVSQALLDKAISQGAPPTRTHLCYTGVDTARFSGQHQGISAQPTVLFIGRLVSFKGCDILINAMAAIRAFVPNCKLIIAGDGPLRLDLQALAAKMSVDAYFLGAVGAARIDELLFQSDILCLPSVTDDSGVFEAFGMVMLEAQAAGVPVVTSARAGPEAIIDGKTGLLFPERDVPALANALQVLLTSPNRRLAMGRASRAHARATFDVNVCIQRIESLYDLICAEHLAAR